jgi:hypothetical protein
MIRSLQVLLISRGSTATIIMHMEVRLLIIDIKKSLSKMYLTTNTIFKSNLLINAY